MSSAVPLDEMSEGTQNKGYFPVPRELRHSGLWPSGRKFTELEATIDLIQEARYSKETDYRQVNGKLIPIRRGELLASSRFLQKRWGWSQKRVMTHIVRLETLQYVIREVRQGVMVLRVCIASACDSEENQSDTRSTTRSDTQSDTRSDTRSDTKQKEGEKKEKESANPEQSLAREAEEIFDLFPKKAARRDALAEIRRALGKVGAERLKERVRLYARAMDGQPSRYVQRADNWFRGERWNDDPATWERRDETDRTDRNRGTFNEHARSDYSARSIRL